MCGINGFNWNDEELVRVMNKEIKHRGPDFQGVNTFNNLSLGHVRLSILDLSEKGNQPMSNNKKDLFIVFNGEIYNYKELAQQYCKDYDFKSGTDTEVILAMYERFGIDCLSYFNGMWAFCIFDKKKETLFCSRDRLGIKPLYYFKDGSKFIFSSEIKAILKHGIKTKINPKAVSSYLRYRYVLEEDTFFTGINKLMPGHNLFFHLKNNNLVLKQYWDIKHEETISGYDEEKPKIEEELVKSIKYRMIADIEVGSILSGGLDSSLLSAIMATKNKNKIKTYTVKFLEEGYDETPYAKSVAKQYGTVHHELEIKEEDYITAMNEYVGYKDEPVVVPNEVALYLLYKEIKKTVSVVLSGEGADEIFAGYGRIFRSPLDYLKKSIIDTQINFLDFFMDKYGYFSEDDLTEIMQEDYYFNFKEIFKSYLEKCPRNYYDKISYLFLKLHLPGLLLRNDVSSMANAIESRVPFLDYNLVQKAYSLPFEYKNKFKNIKSLMDSINLTSNEISENKDIPKYILKDIAKKYISEEIICRKKKGFPLPLDKWFGETHTIYVIKLLLDNKSSISKYINLNKLSGWINKNKSKDMFGQKLWMLYGLEIWLKSISNKYPNVEL